MEIRLVMRAVLGCLLRPKRAILQGFPTYAQAARLGLSSAGQTTAHAASPPTVHVSRHLLVCAGRDKEEVRKDIGRNRYFTPEQAIECALLPYCTTLNRKGFCTVFMSLPPWQETSVWQVLRPEVKQAHVLSSLCCLRGP